MSKNTKPKPIEEKILDNEPEVIAEEVVDPVAVKEHKIGDEVVVDGRVYGGVYGGKSEWKFLQKMYIVEISPLDDCNYKYGVSPFKNSEPFGWTDEESIVG